MSIAGVKFNSSCIIRVILNVNIKLLCLFFRLTVQNYYIKLTKDVSMNKKNKKNALFLKIVHFLFLLCIRC